MFMTNAGAALLLLPAAFPALALILGFSVEVFVSKRATLGS